jgi:transcriptional regulator with XRE-family HTH domain
MVDRIKLILKVHNITASRFADEIGVQRSSISHIVSGRNLPSLDLIQKILKRFPDINSEWLLNGNGSMMRNSEPDLFNIEEKVAEKPMEENNIEEEISEDIIEQEAEINEKQIVVENNDLSKAPVTTINEPVIDTKPEYQKEKPVIIQPEKQENMHTIEKIVIFYSDKTFREYFPE